MLLAGDIGGTKTLLGTYTRVGRRPSSLQVQRFSTLDFDGLDRMIATFLKALPRDVTIDAACFGVAGPVRGNVSELTNIPWRVDASEISNRFSIPSVCLVNDLVAMGYAASVLSVDELAILQPGYPVSGGNGALIAPGTGLGEALLHNINGRFVPIASEGGHADFAPRTAREIELLVSLTTRFGRASWEHVLSGPGLTNIFRFVHAGDHCRTVASGAAATELPALLTESALRRRCTRCVEALDMFVGALGAEASNLGLRAEATAGVFIGGGIPAKILPALRSPTFLKAFHRKSPMEALVSNMPVSVIQMNNSALLGAAVAATHLADGEIV